MIPVRFYIYAGVALLISYLLWREHSLTRRLNDAHHATAQATANLTAEKAARAHEQEIARNASNQFQTAVTSLQEELATRPIKPVFIRVPVGAGVSGAHSTASATPGSDAQVEGRIDGTVEKDIGPELTDFALDCQINTAQLDGLQSWVRAR